MVNKFKSLFFLTALTMLFIFIGNLVGGQSGMVIAFAFAVFLNISSYWFSDRIVLAAYKAKEVSELQFPELHAMVSELAMSAGIPKPKICLVPEQVPNAFATGRNPEHAVVAVTEGILNLLSREELKGVLAHEISHVLNRDILISSVAATVAGAIMMLATMARWAAIFGGMRSDDDNGGIVGLLVAMFVAPIAAGLIQMAISRSREYLADSTGAKLTKNPIALAAALKKLDSYARNYKMRSASPQTAHMFIINPLVSKKAMANLFSTHPSTKERVERLETMIV